MRIINAEDSPLGKSFGFFSSAPSDSKMTLNTKRYPTYVPFFTLFALRSLLFQLIEIFRLAIGYNGEFEFLKKIVKNRKL